MAGWADLQKRQNPCLLNHQLAETEGTDWAFELATFTDVAGNVIDMSTATFDCKVLTDLDGIVVATWTVTGTADGRLLGSLADASTTGTGAGATKDQPRHCVWYCRGTLGGVKVQFWGPAGSSFEIYGE